METKGWLAISLAIVLCTGLGVASEAQPYPTPEAMGFDYSITLGGAYAVNENLSERGSPAIGVAWYASTGTDFGNNAAIGLSGDWMLIQRNDGTDVNLVPIMLNYKQYGIIGNYRVFVNFGVGILATTDAIPTMQLDDGANFGWTGGLGFDLTNQFYAQARFIGGENPGDDGMVAVQVGYRF